jgi:hypothetical protein
MNLIDDKLSGNEKIVYRAQFHWAIMLGPMLVIIIGSLAFGSQGYHALVVIAFGLMWGICSYISFRRSEIGLTGTRMLIDVGFPLEKSYEIALGEIVFIDFYQPSLGAMLDFGKIIIIDKGKKRRAFRLISHPAEFVRVVQQLIVALTPVSTVP